MEILAGDDDFKATVKESGCMFRMHYDKVHLPCYKRYCTLYIVEFMNMW